MRKPVVREHGTQRGYGQHRRAGTKACIPCLDANARDKRARKIKAKKLWAVPVPVDALAALLRGADINRTLRSALGPEVVEAIRWHRRSTEVITSG
jgi:hypothetical protein